MNQIRRIMRAMPVGAALVCTTFLLLGAACTSQSGEAVQIEERDGINPWNHLRFKNDPENFQFAIVTDLTGRLRPNVFPDAVRKLNLLQPEFVVTIGDLIEGHTNDAARLNSEWTEFFKAVEPLEMPMFYVPGNHDYYYKSTQNAAGKIEEYDMAAVYNQRLGRSYYHFVYHNVLFMVLNNSMGSRDEIEAQKRYIQKTLAQHADARWTFTFFHYDQFETGEIWDFVKPLLGDRPFTAFAGNSHSYLKYQDNKGREMIRLATTGGMSRIRGPLYGEFDHISLIRMTDEGPRITNLMLDGIYDTNIRTVKSREMANLLLDGIGGAGSPIASDPVLVSSGSLASAGATVRITNPGELPLRVHGAFEENRAVRAHPAFFDVEVPAKSSLNVPVRLNAGRVRPVHEFEDIVLDWKAGFDLPGNDPDVEVTGKHRIVVDVAGLEPARSSPIVVERFSEVLDPAWIPIGPGGLWADEKYVLNDELRQMAGEEPDSEGRHTDGPLFNVVVHTPAAEDQVYRYMDGRGVFALTPLFHLPATGIYRPVPPGSFEAQLDITDIHWSGDNPELHWEFWDNLDQVYNYGPAYLSGVMLKATRESGSHFLVLQKFVRRGFGPTANNYSYTDLAKVALQRPPSALSLRAAWRESNNSWRFYYGVDGAKAVTAIPGGTFAGDLKPSADGKINMIYVPKTQAQPAFSATLSEYQLRR